MTNASSSFISNRKQPWQFPRFIFWPHITFYNLTWNMHSTFEERYLSSWRKYHYSWWQVLKYKIKINEFKRNPENYVFVQGHYYKAIICEYVRDGILLTSGKHLHGRIISLREEVRTHKTSLTPPLFTGVSLPLFTGVSLPSKEVSILPISTIFLFDFGLTSSDSVAFFCFSLYYTRMYKV